MRTVQANRHLLVVEDDAKVAGLLEDYLSHAGFQTTWLDDGLSVVPWVRVNEPDLVLLDLMLPGKDGIDICREIRGFSDVPIVMVTARVEEIDRLLGLELGADDYVCKPFSPREVVARVKAVLRRTRPQAEPASPGPLTLERHSFRIRNGETVAQLTTVEFQLLDVLYREPGRIFTRGQLIDRIYDDHRVVSDRTVDSHIRKLRKKLDEISPQQELLHSVYGAGYRYEPVDRNKK